MKKLSTILEHTKALNDVDQFKAYVHEHFKKSSTYDKNAVDMIVENLIESSNGELEKAMDSLKNFQ